MKAQMKTVAILLAATALISPAPASCSSLRGNGSNDAEVASSRKLCRNLSERRLGVRRGGEVGFKIKSIEVTRTPQDNGNTEDWKLSFVQKGIYSSSGKACGSGSSQYYKGSAAINPLDGNRNSKIDVNVPLKGNAFRNRDRDMRSKHAPLAYGQEFWFEVTGYEYDFWNPNDPIGKCVSRKFIYENRDKEQSFVDDCGCQYNRCYKIHYEMWQKQGREGGIDGPWPECVGKPFQQCKDIILEADPTANVMTGIEFVTDREKASLPNTIVVVEASDMNSIVRRPPGREEYFYATPDV